MKSYSDKAAVIADEAGAAADISEALDRGEAKPAALIRALESVAKKAGNLATRVRADRDKAKAATEEEAE